MWTRFRGIGQFLPQRNAKHQRYHQTLKRDVNLAPYDVPRELEAAIGEFVAFYNHRRYHKALRDITPADMMAGRREVKDRTINRRRLSNHVLREQLAPACYLYSRNRPILLKSNNQTSG